jgi:putative oxidoreductase
VLAAFFAFAAAPKLAGAHTAVTMFGQIGAGQWLRCLVGTAELVGAAGLLIPWLGPSRGRTRSCSSSTP